MKKENSTRPLLNQIADFENLVAAFHECSRGKRNTSGFRAALFAFGERLKAIEEELISGKFHWSGYHTFYVRDPKEREIMAAPFMDRVVHHAIHRKIEPLIDPLMSDSVFACRKKKGTRHAAAFMLNVLKELGPDRFAIKLDVSKYFNSIDHEVLENQYMKALPDNSLAPILKKLLQSEATFCNDNRGIPIGNLTSQLFANLYLIPVDRVAIDSLGCHYYWDKGSASNHSYVRYMDDLVLVGRDKNRVLDAAEKAIDCAENMLKLKISINKRVPLGKDPIPFLGFVLDHTGYRALGRNQRRFKRKMKILIKKEKRPSHLAQVETSFNAWKDLKIMGQSS